MAVHADLLAVQAELLAVQVEIMPMQQDQAGYDVHVYTVRVCCLCLACAYIVHCIGTLCC